MRTKPAEAQGERRHIPVIPPGLIISLEGKARNRGNCRDSREACFPETTLEAAKPGELSFLWAEI